MGKKSKRIILSKRAKMIDVLFHNNLVNMMVDARSRGTLKEAMRNAGITCGTCELYSEDCPISDEVWPHIKQGTFFCADHPKLQENK